MSTPDITTISLQQVVDVLNEILAADPRAVHLLIEHRVRCNRALADHPTVQVGITCYAESEATYEVGLLGIINGICGRMPRGGGYVAVYYEEYDERDTPPTKFIVLTPHPGGGTKEAR